MYYNDYNNFQPEPVELEPVQPPAEAEPPKKKKGRGAGLVALGAGWRSAISPPFPGIPPLFLKELMLLWRWTWPISTPKSP